MNDLISRRAALRTDCFGDGHDGLRAFHVYEDYKKMRDYIESLPPVQPEPRWIPVTERLPEKDGRYMVTLRDNVYFSPFEDGEWYIVGVTAWQEIPEPYKEGDAE